MAAQSPTIITLIDDYNLWKTLITGGFWIFLEIIVLLAMVFNIVVAIRSLILFAFKTGLNFSLAQICLWVFVCF
jgi:hypothetical protein